MPSAPSILPSREIFMPVISLRIVLSLRRKALRVFLLQAQPAVPERARLGTGHARRQDVEGHVPARAAHQHGAAVRQAAMGDSEQYLVGPGIRMRLELEGDVAAVLPRE